MLEPLEGVCCDELLALPAGCIGSEFCLTSRCLSSGSSSESESSASKASARVGSLTRLFRGAAEDARERKDGGGEDGVAIWPERRFEGG